MTEKPPAQRPSVGRMVHYVSHGTPPRPDGSQAFPSQCRAADITEVDPANPERVGLMVKNPTGLFFHPLADGGCQLLYFPLGNGGSVPGLCSSAAEGGTWHWPERA